MKQITYIRQIGAIQVLILFWLFSLNVYGGKPGGNVDLPLVDRNFMDTIQPDLMTFWKELQRAETLLVQSSLRLNQERRSKIFEGIDLERPLLVLLIRMSSGLNVNGFTASDYLLRYPFSDTGLISERIDELVSLGYLERDQDDDNYYLTPVGLSLMRHYVSEIGSIIQSLDPHNINKGEIDEIISLDHKIVAGLEQNLTAHGSPIFDNRLSGIQPDYANKELWHHWQLVWTMLAALADEEEYVRQAQKLDPIVWFARRRIWFIDRMPWLADSVTAESISNDLQNYAPVKAAKARVEAAIEQLKARGWLREKGDKLFLTEEGLKAQDRDEKAFMDNFFKRWPEFSLIERKRVYNALVKLNDYLESLKNEND